MKKTFYSLSFALVTLCAVNSQARSFVPKLWQMPSLPQMPSISPLIQTEDPYMLELDIYLPDLIKKVDTDFYTRKKGYGSTNLYLAMYGPVLSDREIFHYTQITSNPLWLYANWPYNGFSTGSGSTCLTFTMGQWGTNDQSFRASCYTPFNIPNEIPTPAHYISIAPIDMNQIFAYVLWVVYDDYIKDGQHEPHAIKIKMGKVELVNCTGNLYNQSAFGSMSPQPSPVYEDFYSDFETLPISWTW